VFPIEVPPLRERRDDIAMLLEYFLHRYAKQVGKVFRSIDKHTLEFFRDYGWPGNIRELQNIIERSVILSPDNVFCVDNSWLPAIPCSQGKRKMPDDGNDDDSQRERDMIESALAQSRGRISGPRGAAARLGLRPSTLDSRIKKLKIRKSRFKLG
jgi:transcriptional regulator with GAF, ATPase, and Fis domain